MTYPPRKPLTFAAQGTGVAVAFVAGIILLLAVSPLLVMWGTGVLHDAQPVIPALGFWDSVVACIVGRALTASTGSGKSRS